VVNVLNSNTHRKFNFKFRLPAFIACIAFAWFALSGSVSRLITYAKGDTASMWVCTQTGLKKITLSSGSSESADSASNQENTSDVKHCGDSPIYKQIAIPSAPANLNFEQPRTVATWRWIQILQTKPDLLKDKRRPPGQAPPNIAV
jgi:hypothetical protein